MAKSTLNPKIVEKLSAKLNLQPSTVRQQISTLKQKYPNCTSNAAAQILAASKGLTVMQQLASDDRATLPNLEPVRDSVKVNVKRPKSKLKLETLISYDTTDHFVRDHVEELNRAYTHRVYTAAYILLRKIIENLIVDILKQKYPAKNSKQNLELYWDIAKRRFKDFSIILRNLYDKRAEFGPDQSKAIERVYQLAKRFKDEANDKTHSWYHIVRNKHELLDLQPQDMIELIKVIEME